MTDELTVQTMYKRVARKSKSKSDACGFSLQSPNLPVHYAVSKGSIQWTFVCNFLDIKMFRKFSDFFPKNLSKILWNLHIQICSGHLTCPYPKNPPRSADQTQLQEDCRCDARPCAGLGGVLRVKSFGGFFGVFLKFAVLVVCFRKITRFINFCEGNKSSGQ